MAVLSLWVKKKGGGRLKAEADVLQTACHQTPNVASTPLHSSRHPVNGCTRVRVLYKHSWVCTRLYHDTAANLEPLRAHTPLSNPIQQSNPTRPICGTHATIAVIAACQHQRQTQSPLKTPQCQLQPCVMKHIVMYDRDKSAAAAQGSRQLPSKI